MRARPVQLVYGEGYLPCSIEEATHITLNIPGPSGRLTLPVITKGSRKDACCWTWNGDTEKPTLKPSVLTEGHDFRCHTWITDGKAQFLGDCSHELVGQTIDLGEVLQ